MLLVKLPSVFKAAKVSFQVDHCCRSIASVFSFTLIRIVALARQFDIGGQQGAQVIHLQPRIIQIV